jgi:hypothetical protein
MRYLIETPRAKEECLKALDEQLAKGQDILAKFNFGCKSGDHTGYAIVDAKNEMEARSFIPGFLINKARIVAVDVCTPDAIKSFHARAA